MFSPFQVCFLIALTFYQRWKETAAVQVRYIYILHAGTYNTDQCHRPPEEGSQRKKEEQRYVFTLCFNTPSLLMYFIQPSIFRDSSFGFVSTTSHSCTSTCRLTCLIPIQSLPHFVSVCFYGLVLARRLWTHTRSITDSCSLVDLCSFSRTHSRI